MKLRFGRRVADKNPGPSVFPDFSNPAARKWWGSLYQSFLDVGVAGIWNDMDEPAVFDTASGTMPLDVVFDNEGQPTTHREIHNVYGQLLTRATFEGLSRLRPNERPFVLTRASFAGGQRYAAVWPGDNTSEWSSLRQSISTLLGMGLSGFPLWVATLAALMVHRPANFTAAGCKWVFFLRSCGRIPRGVRPTRNRGRSITTMKSSTNTPSNCATNCCLTFTMRCSRPAKPACPRCALCFSNFQRTKRSP